MPSGYGSAVVLNSTCKKLYICTRYRSLVLRTVEVSAKLANTSQKL